jgi:hypothetical protein
MNYNYNGNQDPNMYNHNMNINPNPNMYGNPNPGYTNNNMNYNPSPYNNPPVIQPQISPIIVSTCTKCNGTGFKLGKKGRKVCKKCRGMVSTTANRQVVVMNQQGVVHHGHIHPQRRTWCGCLKVSKKGYNKCKLQKGCNIL